MIISLQYADVRLVRGSISGNAYKWTRKATVRVRNEFLSYLWDDNPSVKEAAHAHIQRATLIQQAIDLGPGRPFRIRFRIDNIKPSSIPNHSLVYLSQDGGIHPAR